MKEVRAAAMKFYLVSEAVANLSQKLLTSTFGQVEKGSPQLFLVDPADADSSSGSSAHDPTSDAEATVAEDGSEAGWKDPSFSESSESRYGVHSTDDGDDVDADNDDDDGDDDDENGVRSRSRSVILVSILYIDYPGIAGENVGC